MHLMRNSHRVQPFFQHRAGDFGVFRHNGYRAWGNIKFIGLQIGGAQIVAGGDNIIKDLLNVEHQRQVVGFFVVIQAGNTGDVATVDGFLGGMHLLPVKTHNIFHRLDGKCLYAARIFGDQQNIQPGFRLAARYRWQINHRNDLIPNIDHAQ